MLFLV